MSDVAVAAGVSTTTVSLVLSGKAGGSIPDVTKERVFEASRALGYRTNAVARNLRRRSSETIGLISDTIASTPYGGLMVRGADQVAAAAGMTLMIINTERDPEVEARAIDSLLARQVDGLIYATMWHQIVAPPAELREIPSVLLDARSEDPIDSWVVPDEELGGYTATSHLIEYGHRRIGYIHEENLYPAHPERFAGYRRALEESFVLRELRAHRRAPELLGRRRLYQHYPPALVRWARTLFTVGADGRSRSVGRAMRALRQDVVGWRGLRDLWRILRT